MGLDIYLCGKFEKIRSYKTYKRVGLFGIRI